jgi:DHA1 family inner membrane transport protein
MTSLNRRSTLALLALAVSAFAIGTTEFISVGLLPLIAEDLHISVTAAGLTVTLYALGVMLGAPILTSLTSRISRKTLLLWVMIVFIAGNLLAATADGIAFLLAARIIASLSHGVFMSIGSTIAADLVPPSRRASAISVMFSGLTVATVTGVPLGTFIANLAWVPSDLGRGQKVRLSDQAKLVVNGRLLLVFAMTALGYGGTFVVFTYLSPLLTEIAGFADRTTAVILLLYGVAIAIGNAIGGRAANRKPVAALLYMFIAQAVVLIALAFTAPFKIAGLVTLFFMGLFAFMSVPGLQVYVVTLAERLSPQAKDVASAVNIAAFNAGIAIGAYLGGVVNDSVGLIHTTWIGAIMVLGAVLLTAWARSLENQDQTRKSIEQSKSALQWRMN